MQMSRAVVGLCLSWCAVAHADPKSEVAAYAKVAQQAPDKHTIVAQVEAIRALGAMTSASAEAAAALKPIIARDLPPRTDTQQLELHYSVVGAAINAARALGDPSLTSTVLVALYRDPPLAMQARRALTAFGSKAADAARDVLHGKQADVERAFAKDKLDQSCDGGKCQPVGAKEFYAAIVLGDLRDAKAVPDLLAVLAHPALPPYYAGGDPAPTTNHSAALDALRKIGASPAAAKALPALWRQAKSSIDDRAGAIAAYPYVASTNDAAIAAELAKIALDNNADDTLRVAAMLSAAQLSSDRGLVKSFGALAKRYFDAAAKKQAEADKTANPKADAAYEAAKKKSADAKAHAIQVAADPKATVDQIRAAADAAKKALDELTAAKNAHREAEAPHRMAESDAKQYTGYGRMFQAQIGALDLATRCGADATCYADTLSRDPDRITADAAGDIPDLAAWTADDKAGLREATLQRAMLELAHRGPGNAKAVDAVLARLGDTSRVVRQAALLVLPHVAARPCAPCTAKLAEAIKAGEGKTELADFGVEATILSNYFTAP